ncbi:hypothetical protein MHU86_5151 [Fragilaria crotonensis]|nr:hypothetical protein MHU86_5151 [Fragilaria crotonensis]
MTNKKKAKTAAKSKVKVKPDSIADVPGPVAAPAKRPGFSSSQFTGLVFLAVGMSYLLEFRAVLKFRTCNAYMQDFSGECTENDLTMVQAKYNSGILAEVLVAFCFWLCWNDEALLHRLNALLCSSPLVTTLLAMQTTKGMVHAGHLFKLGMLVSVLLIVAASSIYGASSIALRLPLKVDLQNAILLTLSVIHAFEAYKFLSAGVPGFVRVTETTPPSLALLPFLAVDQCTVAGLCFFGIAYLNDGKKRTLLMFISVCQFAAHFLLFPRIRDSLVDPEYYNNLYFGSATFSMTASFAPQVTFLKEPTMEEEEPDESKKEN